MDDTQIFLAGSALAIFLGVATLAGWKHKAFLGSLVALAFILLLLAIFWPTFREARPSLAAPIDAASTSGPLWLAILVFCLLAAGHAQWRMRRMRITSAAAALDPRAKAVKVGRDLAFEYGKSGQSDFRAFLERNRRWADLRPLMSPSFLYELEERGLVFRAAPNGATHEPLVAMFLSDLERIERGEAPTPREAETKPLPAKPIAPTLKALPSANEASKPSEAMPSAPGEFNYSYRKAVLQARIERETGTLEKQAGSEPHKMSIVLAVDNKHKRLLTDCSVHVIGLVGPDGEEIPVNKMLIGGKKFNLHANQPKHIVLLSRDISDKITPEPFLLRTTGPGIVLKENSTYFAAIDLQSAYPHPTHLGVRIDVATGLNARAEIIEQKVDEG